MTVLGIETSCDETAAAVVRRAADGSGQILSNVVRSQLDLHAAYGGVVPEIAARAHVELLDAAISQALARSRARLWRDRRGRRSGRPRPDRRTDRRRDHGQGDRARPAASPFIAVNHLEAHALTAGLTDGLDFPYLLLLVSGGHTQLLIVEEVGRYERLGTTLDDALGEAFDKAAKLLGLRYPGGPEVERTRRAGAPTVHAAPPDARTKRAAFLARRAEDRAQARGGRRARRSATRTSPISAPASRRRWPISSATGRARAIDIYVERLGPRAQRALVVAGGVAANRRLKAALDKVSRRAQLPPRRAAAAALHRQRRDDRLGRRDAPCAWPGRRSGGAGPRPLAARPRCAAGHRRGRQGVRPWIPAFPGMTIIGNFLYDYCGELRRNRHGAAIGRHRGRGRMGHRARHHLAPRRARRADLGL